MSNASTQKSYYDLHTSGIGYLQRVREVSAKTGRRSEPFLACTIAALVGSANNPATRFFDVIVSGGDAKKLVQSYVGIDDAKQQRPVIRFRTGDLWGDAYIRSSGEHAGKPAASLRGRLLKAELIDSAELAKIEQFELITHGIGYLNRPKEVTPENGDPFLGCTIAALTGPTEHPEYCWLDTIVTSRDAQHLVRRCMAAVSQKRQVLIAFRLNDMAADPYIRTKGEHAGKPAASLKSNLFHIGLIKVDKQQVHPPLANTSAAITPEAEGPGNTAEAPVPLPVPAQDATSTQAVSA